MCAVCTLFIVYLQFNIVLMRLEKIYILFYLSENKELAVSLLYSLSQREKHFLYQIIIICEMLRVCFQPAKMSEKWFLLKLALCVVVRA